MSKTGFKLGEWVRFQSHDQGRTIGFIIGPTSQPDDFDYERDYCVVYKGYNGAAVRDSMVAECWIEPYGGYVDDDLMELLHEIPRTFAESLPEVQPPDDE